MTTSSTSVPTIQVGGNFRIGDVSGQVAIGDNISQTQIIYNDCVFVLPDDSTVHGKSWSYIQGIRPSTDPNNIVGRQEELDRIDELFNPTSALAITGFRGTGKSTLASMYIDILEKRGNFAGIFWRKMDESVEITDVVGSFFSVIGKPVQNPGNYKIEDLLNLFFRELNAAPYFLVLDNFEILLDPQTNKPNKAGFSDLIEKVNAGTGRSRILFTSWECPASDRGIRPNCYTIGGLDDQAAIQLLRNHGLTEPDSELKKAVELSGGHPLALILLVQLVIGEEEPLLSILEDNSLWIGKEGEVAENILDKVYNERLSEKEQEFLQFISLYRLPVPLQAIVMAANDPAWTEAGAKKTGLTLKRKSLVQKTGNNYWVESLINNYAYGKLDDKVERHKCAYQYYLSLPLPEELKRKEDVQSLIEAHHHACMTGEYDRAVSIIFDNNLHEYMDRWGNYRTLIELYSKLLPEDHFKDKTLLSKLVVHSKVIGNLGKAYYALGDAKKAIEYYKKALNLNADIGDELIDASNLTNLGIASFYLGNFTESINALEKSRNIFEYFKEELSNEALETMGICLDWLGVSYRNYWELEKGKEFHQKALDIAKRIRNRRIEAHVIANIGAIYLWKKEFSKVIEYWKQSLEISKSIGDTYWVAHYTIDVGYWYLLERNYDEAIKYLEEGTRIAQKFGFEENFARGLMNQGNFWFAKGKLERSLNCYEKALKIAEERKISRFIWRLQHNIGNIYRKQRNYEKSYIQYLSSIEFLEEMTSVFKSESDKIGFLIHRLDPFRSIILLTLEKQKEDEAREFAKRSMHELLEDFLNRRKQGIDLNEEEANNRNFYDGYYIVTE